MWLISDSTGWSSTIKSFGRFTFGTINRLLTACRYCLCKYVGNRFHTATSPLIAGCNPYPPKLIFFLLNFLDTRLQKSINSSFVRVIFIKFIRLSTHWTLSIVYPLELSILSREAFVVVSNAFLGNEILILVMAHFLFCFK